MSFQPPDLQATLRATLAAHHGEAGALLPILHDLQDALGHVPPAFVPEIAAALNLSRAEVHGVITYYHHFRSEPAAKHVIQICRAEACQSMGAEALMAHANLKLCGDGEFTVEAAYCLGLCAQSPAMTLDEEPHACVSHHRFDALVAEARSGA
jgi:formate dehydrogenase subunit gamma